MIQAKTLTYVLIMGMLTAACNSGGSSGGSKPKPANPYGFNNNGMSGPPPLANSQNGNSIASNGNKTVDLTTTTSSATLPGSTTAGEYHGNPAIGVSPDDIPTNQPLTPTMYSPGYAQNVQEEPAAPQAPLTPTGQQQAAVAPQVATPSQSISVPSSAPIATNDVPVAQPTEAPITTPSAQSDDSQTTPTSGSVATAAPVDSSVEPTATAPQAAATTPFSPSATGDDRWTPGLPPNHDPVTDPAHQIVTDPNFPGEKYTDSMDDGLMNHFLAKLNADKSINSDRVFANQITGANVTRVKDAFTVKVQILEDGEATAKKVTFQGLLKNPTSTTDKDHKKKYRLANALLTATSDSKANYHYVARLTCWDQNPATCNSSSIEIFREKPGQPKQGVTKAANSANILAKTYIVYRLGAADLTIANDASASNPNHAHVDKYLMDSFFNSCLQKKLNATADKKAEYEQICAGTKKKSDGAKHILVKSWAVALGTAKFALIFQNDDSETQEFKNALVFRGDLLMSQHSVPLKVAQSGAGKNGKNYAKMVASTDGVELMANDGAGDLNLHLRYAGSPSGASEETRFSVTTDFEQTLQPSEHPSQSQPMADTVTPPATQQNQPLVAIPSAAPIAQPTGGVAPAVPGPAPVSLPSAAESDGAP